MENLLSLFPFRRQSFFAGLCIFIVLLFGGVTVKQNGIALGTTSGYARTIKHLPAKEKAAQKQDRRYNFIAKWLKPDNSYSGLGRMVLIILVGLCIATIGFGIWSVSLFIAAKYVAGMGVGILSLASLFGIVKFLLS